MNELKQLKQLKTLGLKYNLAQRNGALSSCIKILTQCQKQILEENSKDVNACKRGDAYKDRLKLSPERIIGIIDSLKAILELPDPLFEKNTHYKHPKGLQIVKKKIPLGNIALIYESRPNVTIEAAALALKAGNNILLRGSSEAKYSNKALLGVWQKALDENGMDSRSIQLCPGESRNEILDLCAANGVLDLLIPRGGEGLIHFVFDHAKVPLILHFKGNCHLYIHESANLEMAKKVVFDSKTNRYGVCNALESLIIDKSIVNEVLPPLAEALEKKDVSLFLDPEIFSSFKAENCFVAKDEDYYEEYLGPSLSIKAVANIEEAIGHICQYGSDHTDGILAENQDAILEFVNRIDSSCVPVNASTRFNDGFELGLGAEMGISTSKLHAYGPMGLNELTTEKFVVYGNGQIKGNNC